MHKLTILVVVVLLLVLGYGMHKLIRRFINPKLSLNHLFLFFLAHFVGIFMLSFFVNLLIIKFGRFLFRP
jgi:hypothetical protein